MSGLVQRKVKIRICRFGFSLFLLTQEEWVAGCLFQGKCAAGYLK